MESLEVGGSPFRTAALVHVDPARPLDARIVVREGGALDVFARSAALRTAIGAGGLVLAAAIVAAVLAAYAPADALVVAGVGPGVWGYAASRERLWIERDTLVLATGPFGLRRRRVPVRDVTSISVERREKGGQELVITVRGGKTLRVAGRYAMSLRALAWLQQHVARLVATSTPRAEG